MHEPEGFGAVLRASGPNSRDSRAGTLDNATIFTCGGTGLGEVDGRGGIPAEGAAVTGLSVVHGRLSAAYSATESAGAAGIVELTPPKACGLR